MTGTFGEENLMRFRTVLAATVASTALASVAQADGYRIGITQNNVGVDSYQTTYEQAFIAAADANEDIEAVVLDAGGDVARQIAQIEDLIQQEVDAIIIWPTNGEAVIPAVRKAKKAGIPVVVTNSNIAEQGFDFIATNSRTWASQRRRRSCTSPASRAIPQPSNAPRGSRIACPRSVPMSPSLTPSRATGTAKRPRR
jgi:hypothetical protein